jgi:hypothetical protein
VLRHPLHGEFLALLGAVEKMEIDPLLVRKAGFVRQCFEIVQDLGTAKRISSSIAGVVDT